ncbi:xylulokinase [Mesorhizobium sp. BR1-1-16]|uniref:xylulokinase n=1 Tax=Mesorhizobium sp. BR1-1-16 TaxID=2876653 RepID=UPI001CC9C60C|nr:xylulokinase [Mesorhizobium sp. BR1-1-16]MBZ9939075.1 xylulokinase [Mesorhizobium sp. BR1-1-16]
MFVGIDIGTSSVKTVLMSGDGVVLGSESRPLAVQRPEPGWSEQDPESWWTATLETMDALAATFPAEMAATQGIALSGQMHGATLLDENGAVLRPCILWNDGRAAAECAELEAACPDLHAITGNLAMPGFTAPKLIWVRKHEPEIFSRTRSVLLPKAYVRYRMTGEMVDEMSDASGTLWLDVGKRDWSDAVLAATGLDRSFMPRLVEGSQSGGPLDAGLAKRWGMATPPVVAGGAGDNAAAAVGLGAIAAGSAFLSLGTSGVLWVTTDRFLPNPASAVHAFCHAIPETWHQMGVMLSAASALSWYSNLVGVKEGELLAALGETVAAPAPVLFLPYLSGERTPHNDVGARGAFIGLAHEHDRAVLTQAVLEGVAFATRSCQAVLEAAGSHVAEIDLVGGGSRSALWASIMANVLGIPVHTVEDGEIGGAFGAARLARIAATGLSPREVCPPPKRLRTFTPDPALAAAYEARYALWQRYYPLMKEAASG